MSLQKITSDSGICLSAEKHKLKPLCGGSRSNSDSEHSSNEEKEYRRRHSKKTSRIPVRVSPQNSGSDSSDEDHVRLKSTETDSGINLKQRQGKELSIKEVLLTKSTRPSPRETRASALRKQAHLKKAASSDYVKKT
ncbi:hypothetical protein P5673_004283, partial [Acropora cervicornis]